jgi:hypothetical protein
VHPWIEQFPDLFATTMGGLRDIDRPSHDLHQYTKATYKCRNIVEHFTTSLMYFTLDLVLAQL